VADEVQIKLGADFGGAIAGLNSLKQAIAGVAEPVARLKSAFLDTGAAMRQQSAATLVAFRADMRRMVAERALSLREALVLDVDYTARLGAGAGAISAAAAQRRRDG